MAVGSNSILTTGDMIKITINPPAVVPMLIPPIPLIGNSAEIMIMGKAACVDGDEMPPMLKSPMPYMSPPYVTPGMGTLSVTLTSGHKSAKGKNNGKPLLLKGSTFQAKFSVSAPAMMPTPAGPQPDPVSTKTGTAMFITTDSAVEKS